MDGEIQTKIPSTFYCQSLLHFFINNSLTLSHPEQYKGNGDWELWSGHKSFSPSPSSRSLLLCELLSMGCSSSQEPAAVMSPTELQLPSGNIHLPQHRVLHRLQWEYLLHHHLLVAQGHSLLPFSHSMSCRNSSALAPETLPSLLLYCLWCLWDEFSHFYSFLTLFPH